MWEQAVSGLDLRVTKRRTFSDEPTSLAGEVDGHTVEVIRSEGGEEWETSRIILGFKEPLGPDGLCFKRRALTAGWKSKALDWLEDRDLLPNDRWMATIDWNGDSTLVVRARKSSDLRRWLTRERRGALRELGPSLFHLDRKQAIVLCRDDEISVGRIIDLIALSKTLE
jgi:hypothetical protein